MFAFSDSWIFLDPHSDTGEMPQMLNSLDTMPVFILAGGAGERLAPLTEAKPKPAITFGGTHQILDFTLSNCINSGFRQIFALTQYQRDHLHDYMRSSRLKISQTLQWDPEDQLLPLPPVSGKRYRGTADAVFQNLSVLQSHSGDHILITSGDHIYAMDYRPLLLRHISSGAEMTIAAIRRPAIEACEFGVLEVAEQMVTGFIEKPARETLPAAGDVLVNMGVYVFRRSCLIDLANCSTQAETDFGRDIVPKLIQRKRVAAYDFSNSPRNYWRDVGTLDSYFRANMDLLGPLPNFDPDIDVRWPIFSLNDSSYWKTGGSRISRRARIGVSAIHHSVVSHSSSVDRGAVLENTIVLPGAHVGRNARLRNTIVAEGACIPDGVEVGINASEDRRRFAVTREGIVVVNRVPRLIAEPSKRHNFTVPAPAAQMHRGNWDHWRR
jgi:glucose-1-phosphate adenylyltransferase